MKKWEKANAEHHLVAILTLPSAIKPNASDFALTIDAVMLLHHNQFDHAVVASDDADFTQLAVHIREHGKGIHGFGGKNATESLKSAFDSFIVLGVVAKPKVAPAAKPKLPPPVKQPAKQIATKKTAAPAPPPSKQAKNFSIKVILDTFEKKSVDGRLSLSALGKALHEVDATIPSFKGKLKKMVVDAGLQVDDKLIVSKKA